VIGQTLLDVIRMEFSFPDQGSHVLVINRVTDDVALSPRLHDAPIPQGPKLV
jgi:hypothetical protein